VRNRTRTLLAGSMLAVGLVAFAPHASAQEDEGDSEFTDEQVEEITHEAEEIAEANGGTHTDAECIPILLEGGSVDECHEAPSPILPATDELVWGSLSFLVLLFLMWKFAFPAIKGGMTARTERIRSDLDAAEAQKAEAATVLSDYQGQLADARAESARIVEEARQAADEVKANLVAKAEADVAEMRARAAADVEAAKVQAIADLRGEVASLAIGAAESVVGANLDRDASVALVEAYINQVGADR
jgi:F-type H+-transporting ATPase subunit b